VFYLGFESVTGFRYQRINSPLIPTHLSSLLTSTYLTTTHTTHDKNARNYEEVEAHQSTEKDFVFRYLLISVLWMKFAKLIKMGFSSLLINHINLFSFEIFKMQRASNINNFPTITKIQVLNYFWPRACPRHPNWVERYESPWSHVP
jgi:hypothetical protein